MVALEPAQLLLELVAVLGGFEAGDPFLGGGEGDAVAALARLHRERRRKMGLAGAGRAEEADVGVLLDPGQLREMQHERPLRRGLRAPVEVLERLERREARVADACAGAGGVASEHLRFDRSLFARRRRRAGGRVEA
ncbi:MAG TPA: hypothetical protein VJ986_12485 [Gaiellaceae bacterium]|nr:hypothetical protein [Gaiellaceae bacterium]